MPSPVEFVYRRAVLKAMLDLVHQGMMDGNHVLATPLSECGVTALSVQGSAMGVYTQAKNLIRRAPKDFDLQVHFRENFPKEKAPSALNAIAELFRNAADDLGLTFREVSPKSMNWHDWMHHQVMGKGYFELRIEDTPVLRARLKKAPQRFGLEAADLACLNHAPTAPTIPMEVNIRVNLPHPDLPPVTPDGRLVDTLRATRPLGVVLSHPLLEMVNKTAALNNPYRHKKAGDILDLHNLVKMMPHQEIDEHGLSAIEGVFRSGTNYATRRVLDAMEGKRFLNLFRDREPAVVPAPDEISEQALTEDYKRLLDQRVIDRPIGLEQARDLAKHAHILNMFIRGMPKPIWSRLPSAQIQEASHTGKIYEGTAILAQP